MIVKQLEEYCGCVDVVEADVEELIDVISLATGWTRSPCETFLYGDRREVIDIPSCMDCPYEFKPYYFPFDIESFSFSLVRIKGIEETVTPITDFAYSYTKDAFLVDTGLPKCNCKCPDCGCPAEYKLVVTYEAGYKDLPECLLPVFCNLLEVIRAKNNCDCTDCSCNQENVVYDRYGNIVQQNVQYASGDVVTVMLETDLGKMLVQQYKNQIALLSLNTTSHDIWGFVV